MSDLRLFSIKTGNATELTGSSDALEKSLQTLFESNLQALLGVTFLATEYSTGPIHRGRIDTLGIDENGCPVIIEYKRAVSENVVNQGLFYLDWLLDHQAEFKLLVMDQLGKEPADNIDWSIPRLICIASHYKKYDEHAIRQINRNIDLISYRRFGDDLLAMELASSVSTEAPSPINEHTDPGTPLPKRPRDKTFAELLSEMTPQMRDLYEAVRSFCLGLGDDVNEKHLQQYVAFRRIRNFATVAIQKKNLRVYAHIDPSTIDLEDGFTRDVSEIGHWGTGNVEICVTKMDDLRKAEPLILRSYEQR
jgi:predicted transport protein